jgi:hypothetical protein
MSQLGIAVTPVARDTSMRDALKLFEEVFRVEQVSIFSCYSTPNRLICISGALPDAY